MLEKNEKVRASMIPKRELKTNTHSTVQDKQKVYFIVYFCSWDNLTYSINNLQLLQIKFNNLSNRKKTNKFGNT